jgi:hypothetical protein
MEVHSNGGHFEKHDTIEIHSISNGWHFEKHDLTQ